MFSSLHDSISSFRLASCEKQPTADEKCASASFGVDGRRGGMVSLRSPVNLKICCKLHAFGVCLF